MRGRAGGRRRAERRIVRIGVELRELRSQLAVHEEQLVVMLDDVEEARVAAVLSERRGEANELRDSERHVELVKRHIADLRRRIADLEAERDALLLA